MEKRTAVESGDFQKRIQKIGELVQDMETIADPAARTAAKDLVRLLMDLHGTGLERILEIVFQSGDGGARLIEQLGEDSLVSSLLVLYGLHPDDLQTRVERKLAQIRSKLFKMGVEATLTSISGSEIRLRVRIEAQVCGSTRGTVKSAVEEAMYEAAPDLTALVLEGLEEPAATGFVAIGQLLGSSVTPAEQPAALNSDGMD